MLAGFNSEMDYTPDEKIEIKDPEEFSKSIIEQSGYFMREMQLLNISNEFNNTLIEAKKQYYVDYNNNSKSYIVIKDIKYSVYLDFSTLGLDLTGDTIMILKLPSGGLLATNVINAVTPLVIGEEIKDV